MSRHTEGSVIYVNKCGREIRLVAMLRKTDWLVDCRGQELEKQRDQLSLYQSRTNSVVDLVNQIYQVQDVH